MIKKLENLLKNSYSPYSKVKVASVLVDKDGNEYEGVNVENASFGATICAERNAIWQAIATGKGVNSFKEIHVASSLDKFLFPCSICRQVMTEFFSDDTKIILHHKEKNKSFTLKELVPYRVQKNSFDW